MTMTTPFGAASHARFGLASEGTMRVAALTVVPDLLREAGLDPVTILAEIGLARDALDDPERLIAATQVGALLDLCAARTGWEDFGLRVGARGGLHTVGLIGELARHAPTVAQALREIVLNLHLHDRMGIALLDIAPDTVSFGYTIYRLGTPGTRHIIAGAMAIATNMLRELCGKGVALTEVRLALREPRDPTSYRRFFRAPVRFNADEPLIVFPARWLGEPLTHSDADKREQLQGHLAAVLAVSDDDLRDKLKRLLRMVLVHEGGSEDQVAAHFALHRRTLNRRLHALGATFHGLVEETRFEIARQLLSDTDMTALQIAAVLNYADASAFTRAFKRWSGTTPQAWRARTQEAIRVPGVPPQPAGEKKTGTRGAGPALGRGRGAPARGKRAQGSAGPG
jgi:AraC-like DNA-binding protein